MFIDFLNKIIGMVGLVVGIELIAIAIFSVSVLYFRNPIVAGVIGNLSSLEILSGTLVVFVNNICSNYDKGYKNLEGFYECKQSTG